MPVKRPIVRYAMLAFLFAITMVYEVRYTGDILRGERVDVPFFITESATNRIELPTRTAQASVPVINCSRSTAFPTPEHPFWVTPGLAHDPVPGSC